MVDRFYVFSFGKRKARVVYPGASSSLNEFLHQMLIQRLLNRFLGTVADELFYDLTAFEN